MKEGVLDIVIIIFSVLIGRILFGYLGGAFRYLWNIRTNPKSKISDYFEDKDPADGISSNSNINRIVGFVVLAFVLIILKKII